MTHAIIGIGLALILIGGFCYWIHLRNKEFEDDGGDA